MRKMLTDIKKEAYKLLNYVLIENIAVKRRLNCIDSCQDAKLTKQSIRSKILLKFKNHKEEDREKKSSLIKEKLFRTKAFKNAKIVMFFISFGGEVNTQDMINKTIKLGKKVAVPVCGKNMSIRPCMLSKKISLIPGLFGIPEPAIKRFVNLEKLDLVIVPGLAFDRKGHRLGRGKGYYDTLLGELSSYKAVSIGLAFDFQILPSIPFTPQDKRVDKVIFA